MLKHEGGKADYVVPDAYLINNAVFGRHIAPADVVHNRNEPEIRKRPNITGLSYQEVNAAQFEEVLQKVAPTTASVAELARERVHHDLGVVHTRGKMIIPLNNAIMFNFTHPREYCQMTRLRGSPTKVQNVTSTLHTMVVRYGGRDMVLPPNLAQAYADDMWEGFCKFVDPAKLKPVTQEQLDLAAGEQVARIILKGINQDEGIVGDSYSNTARHKFHLKQQCKAELRPNGWLRLDDDGNVKAGQGISAGPKTLNHIAGAYVRAMEQNIMAAFREGVALAYGLNHDQLNDIVEKHTNLYLFKGDDAFIRHNGKTVSSDISQQDTTKAAHSMLFTNKLYKKLGVPENVRDFLLNQRYKWKISSLTQATLEVYYKFPSGHPDTLFNNVVDNMARTGACYDFGDVLTEVPHPIFQLKRDYNDVGDFVGYLIADRLYLDLPRLAVKLANRSFHHDDDLELYRIAVRDWLAIYVDSDHIVGNSAVVAHKYPEITPEEAGVLLGFLLAFANGKYLPSVKDGTIAQYPVDKHFEGPYD
jgi:hypothetical protein